MGKKELYVTVPSFFRCPISLDVMKSPVSLSTGVTYDRTSIQRWLESGNNTCPATMQVLDSKDFVPNHTLHRLIQIWSNNHHHSSAAKTPPPQQQLFHSLSSAQVVELIDRVSSSGSHEARFDSFVKILCFASESPENRKFLTSNEGFVATLAEILASDGPDLNPNHLESVLKLFQIVTAAVDDKLKNKVLLQSNPNLISNLAKILKSGRSDSRLAVARILEATAVDQESKKTVIDNHEILLSLLDILSGNAAEVVEAAEIQSVLSCLISLSSPRRNKVKLIEAGGVVTITAMISTTDDNNNYTIIELLLTLLEMLVGCTEGRAAITDDPNCVPAIVQKLMKVSTAANEHAVALLWSLCYLFRDQKAREAMTRRSNGGLTKILLLMQSDCSPAVKRMCCDLLRIFRVNSKSCLSNYDTKTTHIMPC